MKAFHFPIPTHTVREVVIMCTIRANWLVGFFETKSNVYRGSLKTSFAWKLDKQLFFFPTGSGENLLPSSYVNDVSIEGEPQCSLVWEKSRGRTSFVD